MNQGYLGNCWFLSTIANLAEKPGAIESLFLNTANAPEPAGIYGVKFFLLGLPYIVIVDDYIPIRNGYESALFARLGDDGSFWGTIFEKAFAKYHGNYEHIEGGWMALSMRTLTNAPFETTWHMVDGETVDGIELFDSIRAHLDAGD